METITLEYTKSIKEQKELPIPFYTKIILKNGSICSMSKVVDKENCIHITDGTFAHIQLAHAGLAFHLEWQEATPEEFDEYLTRVSNQLLTLCHAR